MLWSHEKKDTPMPDAGHAAAPPTGAAFRPYENGKHIVDVLIEERCPHFANSPAWPLVRPGLYRALNYAMARKMADAIAPMSGPEAMAYVSRLLALRLDLRNADRLPKSGRVVIVANHPTGIADGVAVFDAVKAARPDVIFFANADAHRVCPGFDQSLIPVEWVQEKRTIERTKKTLRAAQRAFQDERAVMIFPAGRLARVENGEILDPPWEPSAVSLARKHNAPILPIWMDGPYAFLFHTFDRFSQELRDITLFHELLNKAGKLYTLKFGPLIPAEKLAGEAEEITLRLKRYVETILPRTPDAAFE
jgi:putative hemolysin